MHVKQTDSAAFQVAGTGGALSPRRTPAARKVARRRPHAFVLLEIILALGLFSLVAVAMTRALDQIAKTSKAVRSEGQVLRVMESVLAQVEHQPELKIGGTHFDAGADGVEADATIESTDLLTRNKARLDHLFLIRVKAWIPDGRARLIEREMETYVYSPNSKEK